MNTDDKNLLEKAAKAAGVFLTPKTMAAGWAECTWDDTDEPEHIKGGGMRGTVFWYSESGELGGTEKLEWNPLADDGDALRLAVKLGIDVQQFVDSRMVEAWKHPHQACGEDYGDDPCAATRRAIVRAAAALASA